MRFALTALLALAAAGLARAQPVQPVRPTALWTELNGTTHEFDTWWSQNRAEGPYATMFWQHHFTGEYTLDPLYSTTSFFMTCAAETDGEISLLCNIAFDGTNTTREWHMQVTPQTVYTETYAPHLFDVYLWQWDDQALTFVQTGAYSVAITYPNTPWYWWR